MRFLSALFNIAQTIAPNVVSAVTNAVTAIANTVVGIIQGNAELPEPPAQSNTQPRPPATPAGPSPEEIRQRQINRRARQFDRDLGRKARPAIDGDTRFYNELTPDTATDFRGRINPADLILAAASNPVIYGIVEMMKHERPTLAAFMQHPVRSTADTLRLLFADAVHYEHFTAEAAAWWDQVADDFIPSAIDEIIDLTLPITGQLVSNLSLVSYQEPEPTPTPTFENRASTDGIELTFSAGLQLYRDQESLVLIDTLITEEPIPITEPAWSTPYEILGRSSLNSNVIKIRKGEWEFWISLNDPNVSVNTLPNFNLSNLPIVDDKYTPTPEERIASYTNTHLQGTVEMLPLDYPVNQIGIIQFATRNPAKYSTLPDFRHPGMDFFALMGTPNEGLTNVETPNVVSVTDGEVVGIHLPVSERNTLDPYSGGLYIDPRNPGNNDAPGALAIIGLVEEQGAYVVVRSGDATLIYAHLDPASVQVGQNVVVGQIIGSVYSGYDAGEDGEGSDHLHFEVRTYGQNPATLDSMGHTIDKPFQVINPAYLFTEEFVEANINPGLERIEAPRFPNRNASYDALTQNTQAFTALEGFPIITGQLRGDNGRVIRTIDNLLNIYWPDLRPDEE